MGIYKQAAQVIARFSRKYEVKKRWLWDLLEDNFNMYYGQGALMDAEEIADFEAIIKDRLAD